MIMGRKVFAILSLLSLSAFLYYQSATTTPNLTRQRPATPEPDPRIILPALQLPAVELYEKGKRVYYTTKFFVNDNITTRGAPTGTCRKRSRRSINPFDRGVDASVRLVGPMGNGFAGNRDRLVGNGNGMAGNRNEFAKNAAAIEIMRRIRKKQGVEDCSPLHFMPPGELPITALASAPGSGNTWVRHLVQQLTGIYTGAVYNDNQLREGGFLGEFQADSTVVAVKTHEHWNCSAAPPRIGKAPFKCPRYEKAILIVRDPHEAILAEFNRYNSNGVNHQGIANEELFYNGVWDKFAMILAQRWYQTAKVWTLFGNYQNLDGCLLIVSFKNLKTKMKEELVKIGKFLGVEERHLEGDHIDCVVRNSRGAFKRNKQRKVSLSDIYDEKMNKTIEMYKERVNIILTYLKAGFTV